MSSLRLKRRIIDAVCEMVETELSVVMRAAQSAHHAATHEEAKPENDKDTRSVEAAYLAGAQASRAAELQHMISRLRTMELAEFDEQTPLGAGAIVELEENGAIHRYLLLPVGGGMKLQIDGVPVSTISVSSPLGSVLCGTQVGDDVELDTPRGVRELHVHYAA